MLALQHVLLKLCEKFPATAAGITLQGLHVAVLVGLVVRAAGALYLAGRLRGSAVAVATASSPRRSLLAIRGRRQRAAGDHRFVAGVLGGIGLRRPASSPQR